MDLGGRVLLEILMHVSLSPKQRFELSILFYAAKPEGDILGWTKAFNRTRLALGLTPIMDVLTGKPFNPARLTDDEAKFEITDDQRDFLLQRVLPNITTSVQAVRLGALIDILETHKVTGQAVDVSVAAYAPEEWALPVDAIDQQIHALVQLAKQLKVEDKELFSKVQMMIEAVAN